MQPHKVTSNTCRFYDQLLKLELRRCQLERSQNDLQHKLNMNNILNNKKIFMLLEEDLIALDEKEEISIRPLPEKTYYDNGKVRVTVLACDKAFQDRICMALIRRNYADTDDSTGDVRIMERDNINFVVTTIQQKKSCSTSCSVCKCNH